MTGGGKKILPSLMLVGGLALGALSGAFAGDESVRQAAPVSPSKLTLTLREALAAAADNNPDVLLHKERIEASKGQVLTQLGAMLPNLSSTVRQTRQTQFLGTFGLAPVRTDPFSIFDARVNASQNLFSLSLIQRWRASRETLHATEFEAEMRKLDTMASVALVYMENLKAAAMVKMRDANQRVMIDLLGKIRHRQSQGAATGLDRARLEGQLANERQQTTEARYEMQRTMLTLINLLALPYDLALSLTDEFHREVGAVSTPEAAVEEALTNRPEVRAQYTRVRASELTYSSIAGERVPSLVAQGDYGLIGNRWNNSADTYNMAVLLQVPIFDGVQREGRVVEARSQLRQEALRMRSVLNQVKMEVYDALAASASAQEQMAVAQAGLDAATKELALALERYGLLTAASPFEVTNALNAVARAKENHVNALFQLNAARVNLARATGALQTLK
ncbi:putative Outer membrane efflux protein [Nitrospira sp. KM1]|uniref:TolC family protein n=1 Tax=Nitrospira sp. KM1 TaxID=1936990 RepID=UPI0013A76182|nr:TolC family protein [Nitrospira sp. KM1]BCA56521.1 putative Outer membrane efflux protein [Nitrospira sp. KM1]